MLAVNLSSLLFIFVRFLFIVFGLFGSVDDKIVREQRDHKLVMQIVKGVARAEKLVNCICEVERLIQRVIGVTMYFALGIAALSAYLGIYLRNVFVMSRSVKIDSF